jgi:hypothetical protein
MLALPTLLTLTLTHLALTASAGDCKTFQMYCGSTLKWRGTCFLHPSFSPEDTSFFSTLT